MDIIFAIVMIILLLGFNMASGHTICELIIVIILTVAIMGGINYLKEYLDIKKERKREEQRKKEEQERIEKGLGLAANDRRLLQLVKDRPELRAMFQTEIKRIYREEEQHRKKREEARRAKLEEQKRKKEEERAKKKQELAASNERIGQDIGLDPVMKERLLQALEDSKTRREEEKRINRSKQENENRKLERMLLEKLRQDEPETGFKPFMVCHLAGRKYHDADAVLRHLKPGTVLQLSRDSGNPHDSNAVAVMFHNPDDAKDYRIGYIPRSHNETIASMLDMGWTDAFQCIINSIDPDAHPEHQVYLTINITRHP